MPTLGQFLMTLVMNKYTKERGMMGGQACIDDAIATPVLL